MSIIKNDSIPDQASEFYQEILLTLINSGIPFMIGGSFAVFYYTQTFRTPKDIDIYCKPADYPAILKLFANKGYETELTDIRWLAKVSNTAGHTFDIIFDTVNNIAKVDDGWFERAHTTLLFEQSIKVIAPEDLIWGKLYVQNRERFDGADINHLFLKCGKKMDWRYLRDCVEPHWHLLLAAIILFQFVYPHDYPAIIPQWLFDELMARAKEQYELPPVKERVSRGPLIDQTQYQVDILDWGYKSYTIKTV